ncbi:hypothetical protein I4641_05930 [Waterburya agarophytonicola K14]|uniref:Ycf66 n=1 Tax=Waterburya agarophytonicola KI4 TaxID=2874699 RepID=A0A964FF12_9CYAN|nr:Ycf66 family protein [Waterburya agarophytonicola]MCC0176517.1 hypothetical protein [Waterburya agarophytonicola KI4]
MLSYALAISVALSSLVLFSTAFLMSDIHRKDDFLWSGVGLFYALVLWFCARNITGAVLLGQASASILLVSFCWQTLKLRKAIANPERATQINNFSVLQAVNGLLKRKKSQTQGNITPPVAQTPAKITESEISIPDQVSTKAKSSKFKSDISQTKPNKSKAFGKFFGGKKQATITNTKLEEILDEPEINTVEKKEPESKITARPPEEKPQATVTEEVANPQPQEIVNPDKKEQVIEEIKSIKTEIEMPSIESLPEKSSLVETTTTNTDLSENITQDEPKSDLEKTPTEIVSEVQVSESSKSVSALDSLETVEVAEVLEAVPENISSEKNSYRSEIIEVDPTEIDDNSDREKT